MPKTAQSKANPPKARRRKEARPGEIIAARLKAFSENGFAATRLEITLNSYRQPLD